MPGPARRRSRSALEAPSAGGSELDISFPWLPALAPLVTAFALWVATGSALSLLFGIMSPVMLATQYFESRRQSRRRRERQHVERENAEAQERRSLALERQREVREAQQEFPPAQALIALIDVARLPVDRTTHMRPANDRSGARNDFAATTVRNADARVRLGTTEDGHPFCVSAVDGILVVGDSATPATPPVHAGLARRAVSRAMTAQLWWATGDVGLTLTEGDLSTPPTSGRPAPGVPRWLVTVASADQAFVLDRDAPARARTQIRPDTLSSDDLEQFRKLLHLRAERTRRESHRRSELETVSRATDPSDQFDVTVGETSEGHPFVMNLMRDGPHCVISGTTGSGKTSFIVGWLSRLCMRVAPSSLEIAIIDFKGGIDFVPLETYPHCVGFATDLQRGEIDRALIGLGAEVERRERELRSGRRLDELTRLIVVLDEFRAITSAHPRANALVVDLAARGRALGIHLVVCTQRASSSISEDILANVPLRIAFRALTRNESVFLVGDDSAHRGLVLPGDAIVATTVGESIRVHMTPPAGENQNAGQTQAWARHSEMRRLWAESLPTQISRIEVEALPRRAHSADEVPRAPASTLNYQLCLGVVDAPDRQQWESSWYSPPLDGHLLITGTARTGRSATIRALADAATAQTEHQVRAIVIADEVALWDWFDPRCQHNLTTTGVTVSDGPASNLVLLDGIESMMSNLNPDARDELSERLMRALRTPDSRAVTESTENRRVTRFVIACDSDGAWASRFSPLCAQRLDLDSEGPPGRARFAGATLQVPFVERTDGCGTTTTLRSLVDVPPETGIVVVNGDFVDQHSLQADHTAILASARSREWLERLGEFSVMTSNSAILVRGNIPPSDARLLFRGRTPLPPVWNGQSILLLRDGSYERLTCEP